MTIEAKKIQGDLKFSGPVIFKKDVLITGSLIAGSVNAEKSIIVNGDYIVDGNDIVARRQTILGNQYINGFQRIGGLQIVKGLQYVHLYQMVNEVGKYQTSDELKITSF